jgi:hypothetical protein
VEVDAHVILFTAFGMLGHKRREIGYSQRLVRYFLQLKTSTAFLATLNLSRQILNEPMTSTVPRTDGILPTKRKVSIGLR